MAWTLSYNRVLCIVEIEFVGKTTAPEMEEATIKGIELSKEQGVVEFLIDTTELRLAASIFDLLNLPDTQYVAKSLSLRSRVALVLPKRPKDEEAMKFYETACVNVDGWYSRF